MRGAGWLPDQQVASGSPRETEGKFRRGANANKTHRQLVFRRVVVWLRRCSQAASIHGTDSSPLLVRSLACCAGGGHCGQVSDRSRGHSLTDRLRVAARQRLFQQRASSRSHTALQMSLSAENHRSQDLALGLGYAPLVMVF